MLLAGSLPPSPISKVGEEEPIESAAGAAPALLPELLLT